MARVIEYYCAGDGEYPIEDFFDSLTAKEQQKVFWVLKLVEDLDRVPTEYFKKLKDTEDIWECRIKSGSNAYRIFSFFFCGNTLVLTHGYSKKSQKTDLRQIRKAQKYRNDYLARQKRR